MAGASKERLLAAGGFVPEGLPVNYWSDMFPPLEPEVAEVVLDASHATREPTDEVNHAQYCRCRCRYGTGGGGTGGTRPLRVLLFTAL